MKRENSLDALTEGNFPDFESGSKVTILTSNHNPFKNLDSLLIALLDFHVDPDRISYSKCG
jgi:hypothetical protein